VNGIQSVWLTTFAVSTGCRRRLESAAEELSNLTPSPLENFPPFYPDPGSPPIRQT